MEATIAEPEEVVLIAGPLDGQRVAVDPKADRLEFPMRKDGNVFAVLGQHPGGVMYCVATYIRSCKKPGRFLYDAFFELTEGKGEA